MRKNGLTLIEALVLVVILCFILLFFYGVNGISEKNQELARKIVCAANLKGQINDTLVNTYDNDGNVYTYAGQSSSVRELTFEYTRLVYECNETLSAESYYCPSRRKTNNPDIRLWQYTLHVDKASLKYKPKLIDESGLTEQQRKENFRITDYVYLFDKVDNTGKSVYTDNRVQWISNINEVSDHFNTPAIIDVVTRDKNTGKYFDIDNIKLRPWSLTDKSNHKSDEKDKHGNPLPAVANHAYLDGHVLTIPFSELTDQYEEGNQIYMWADSTASSVIEK